MHPHPEADGELNRLISEIGNEQTRRVWCKGCEDYRPVNARFYRFLNGEIESCSRCRLEN